ncbi:MAG TPA: glycosyltransferase [Polyangiaceae bacterium]|nr:glycosyltransferase [Polyangiaceae bacterium]
MNQLNVTETKVNSAGISADFPKHIGILNDYVRVPYANGSSFASQFLYREFSARGHEVTIVGADDPDTASNELPESYVCLKSLPLRNHPGVRVAFPTPRGLQELADKKLDLILGQTCTELLEAGIWLRAKQRVPAIAVNTVHLPSVYNVVLPDSLYQVKAVQAVFEKMIAQVERYQAGLFNRGDGLIVLSEGLKHYWTERGVTVPIHVIPRSVDPSIFDRGYDHDPFPAEAKRGSRLLVVCRMTREKEVARLLDLFARLIVPAMPDATLTLVGDGPDYDAFVQLAEKLDVASRTFFLGERPLQQIPGFYRHADLFVYTSLSETYGQVVSEALWCGLPAVALADGMGVSQQIVDGETGVLVDPTAGERAANWRFAKAVITLLRDRNRRQQMSERATQIVRERAAPERCIARYYEAFDVARQHLADSSSSKITDMARGAQAVATWTAVHLELAALGLLRKPAKINRNGTKQPVWEQPPEGTSLLESAIPPRGADSRALGNTSSA